MVVNFNIILENIACELLERILNPIFLISIMKFRNCINLYSIELSIYGSFNIKGPCPISLCHVQVCKSSLIEYMKAVL